MKAPENSYFKHKVLSRKIPSATRNTTPVIPTAVKNVAPISKAEMEAIHNILSDTVKLENKKRRKIIECQEDAEGLKTILQEYLSSFIVIGYSAKDNARLVVKAAGSQRDEDALIEELRFVFFNLIGGQP